MKNKTSRREAIKNIALGTGAIGLGGMIPAMAANCTLDKPQTALKGNINHSVCRWTFPNMSVNDLAQHAKEMGLKGIDLLRPEEWETVQNHGLQCSMATAEFAVIEHGFNDPANHERLQGNYRGLIDSASKNGIKNVICFSGNRRGMSDETGIENCAKGLSPLLDYAAKRDVTMVMELLNSKVDHPDYQCDHTAWGATLAEKMGKDNFKLLYDIYHMQIMEGDIIATIGRYNQYINHYHTAGVPGRNEINEQQELYYPAIMRAIVETGFDGFVAQEFIPTYDNKLEALKEAIKICDV